jgi:hypothetical protein
MHTGFVPNGASQNLDWPLTISISNLMYQKSINGQQTYSTSTKPSQDIWLSYGEVDSAIRNENAASPGAAASLMTGLTAAGAVYFGRQ